MFPNNIPIIAYSDRFFYRNRQAGGFWDMNNLIIGIAGGSGSGKTTLAYRLKERFGEDEVRLISHDSTTSATMNCPLQSAAS